MPSRGELSGPRPLVMGSAALVPPAEACFQRAQRRRGTLDSRELPALLWVLHA